MTEQALRALIAAGETLTVEFKSDQGPLSDSELIEAIACLANGRGGTLLIGIEDDGRVTGLHPRHQTHPAHLAALVASRTVPPLAAEAEFVNLPEGKIAVLTVPAAHQPVSTSDGRLLTRYWNVHGRPGCRPLYAYELTNWLAERGQADATALVLPDATWDDLDPLEFARLRRMTQENFGDRTLLELSEREVAAALGLVRGDDGHLTPTVAGLLLVGKEEALRHHLPAHEVAFQVLRGLDVAVNEFRRWPLLRIQEWLMEAIGVRNEEQELMVGGVRIGVPRYDRAGIREAINNALIHRDYTQLGAVHVQLRDDHARVGNPGGFVQGVRPDNLLVVEPKPRNPRLADAFKRIGLVERTGRGVETVYRGQLRNGRQLPNYAHSNEGGVLVVLDAGPADLDFVRLLVQASRRLDRPLAVTDLLALWMARREGLTHAAILAPEMQSAVAQAQDLLASLAQAGLLEKAAQAYRIAPELYRAAEVKPRPVVPEDAILGYLATHGRITRSEVVSVCGVSERQASYLLQKLTQQGRLVRQGSHRGSGYALAKASPAAHLE